MTGFFSSITANLCMVNRKSYLALLNSQFKLNWIVGTRINILNSLLKSNVEIKKML